MQTAMRFAYPFSAIVGQEEMKLALLLHAVDPNLGGVLLFGERGTGKSTAVRSLASLLPPLEAVLGCPYRCDPKVEAALCSDCATRRAEGESLPVARVPRPVVDLPLGATEDRILGTIDLEAALATGERRFQPGLLAQANRGFLYIDEVNLLSDHLVDLLLDAAASGENVVEREGLSLRHPARFVLVGSGNPEEGDLRPQLLDRFALAVKVETLVDTQARAEVLRRRLQFSDDPLGFATAWQQAETGLQQELIRAQSRLADIVLDDDVYEAVARLGTASAAVGHRGELALLRGARALAALEGRTAADLEHVRRIAPLALNHRVRPEGRSTSESAIDELLDEVISSVKPAG